MKSSPKASSDAGSGSNKSNREIILEFDAYIKQFGRQLTAEEEQEVLDLPMFEKH